jgi:hypothetical protein
LALGRTVGRAQTRLTTGNSGATRFIPSHEGDIKIVPLDALDIPETVDFVKIDVEGAELDVFAGMDKFLEKHRPALFIEVNERNRDKIHDLMQAKNYKLNTSYRRYPDCENFLYLP